jgi:hypothetical protein
VTAPAFDFERLPRPYREAWAFHEAYRRLGFPADVVFISTDGKDGHVQLNVCLCTHGQEVVATAGFLADTIASVRATWTEVATAIADGRVSTAALLRMWTTSMANAQICAMPFVLLKKGIPMPPIAARPVDPRPNRNAN